MHWKSEGAESSVTNQFLEQLTVDYAQQIAAKLEEIKASTGKNDAEVAQIKSDLQALMAKAAQGNQPGTRESIGSKFANSYASPEVQTAVAAALKSDAPKFRWEPKISVKDYFSKQFVGVEGGNSPGNDFPAIPEFRPGVIDAPIPPTIFDVLPVIPTNSDIYSYTQLNVSESHNHAAIVAEGTLKPTSLMDFKRLSVSPVVFAHLLKFSKQMQDDNPQVTGLFIPAKLRKWLLQVVDAEVLNGPGGTGRIDGLYTQASALTVTGQPNDRIGSGVSQMRALGYNPTVVIVNANDAFGITSERATSGDGQYVGGVKFGGLPTVQSANATVNTALIIDASTLALLERDAPSFQIGLTDDDWSKNLWTGRSECRLTMAIFDLGGVRKVALS